MTLRRSSITASVSLVLVVILLALTACTTSGPDRAPAIALPPVAGRFSYQLGGSYAAPAGVTIVDRDRTAPPAKGLYSICYVNAFQAQAEATDWWTRNHPQLLLRQPSGALVIDTQWNEPLLDISTPAKRTALLVIVGGWIDGCAKAGYRAVEADNLDSYTRSKGLLTIADALAFGSLLAVRAHHDHLAIAQKNAADLSARARRSGFDFAVTEECQVYDECDAYSSIYGRHVIEIEYTDNSGSGFAKACSERKTRISVVLRDRDLTPAGAPQHVEKWCP